MMNILLFFWQLPSESKVEAGIGTAIIIALAGLAGAIIKSLVDWFLARNKVQSDIDLSVSTAKKNENEIVTSLQDRLLSTQRLLMEMQENLAVWIRRFEKTATDASAVENELRLLRTVCDDCMSGRKGYFDFCSQIGKFFDQVEPILMRLTPDHENPSMIDDLKSLRSLMHNLQQRFEKDMKIINK